jgi:NAD(P)-dependent dehydrogenase (short-subunit alcohol dehydrogenase family)
MEIKDKVVLITGSAHRVGKSIAMAMANRKGKVVVHYYLNENQAIETSKEIDACGVESMIVKGDVRLKKDWFQMRDDILRKWGRIDILVNNAAIFYKTALFDITEKDYDNFLNTNLKSVFWGCQIIGKLMYEQGSGKIINISDVSGEKVWKDYIPYCVSKAGVNALTKGMAKALAPHVLVNTIAPGTVLLAEEYDEKEENALIQQTPLKRVGMAEDIAKTVVFLVEGTDFITGATVNVDGGRSIV